MTFLRACAGRLYTGTLVLALLLTACSSPHKEPTETLAATTIKYARQFNVQPKPGGLLVTVFPGNGEPASYWLYNRNTEAPAPSAAKPVGIPVESIVCLSSPHITLISSIGEAGRIKGIESQTSLYDTAIINQVGKGQIFEVGNYESLNLESLVKINPELITGSATGMDNQNASRLSELELTVASIPAHYENHPLGRLEWIKFFALLFNRQQRADSIFNLAEREYLRTSETATTQPSRPTVIAGYYSKGTWVAPGGRSYFAQLLKDAGADYIWKNDTTTGNLRLSYEEALEKGIHADIFINIQMLYKTREELLAEMPESGSFASIKANRLYMNNAQVNEAGKNNYWEQGFVQPHIILKDLASIFHPGAFPGYTPVYFK
jgi:iron complex transport system substrate-binding protein